MRVRSQVEMELAIDTQNPAELYPASRLVGLRPFSPGESPNPGGRPKTAILRRQVLRHLRLAVAKGANQLDCVIDGTIRTAIEGGAAGVAAFNALRDTVDGKPTTGNDAPILNTVNVEIVTIGQQT